MLYNSKIMRSYLLFFFFSSRRRHTRWNCDWSSDVCSSDLQVAKRDRSQYGARGCNCYALPSHYESKRLPSGVFRMGAHDDGSWGPGDHGVPAARQTPDASGPDQSTGDVGVHGSCRQTLDVHQEILDPAAGREQPGAAEAGNV